MSVAKRSWKVNLADAAAYGVLRLVVAVIQTLPLDMGDRACRWLAAIAGGKLRVRRRTFDGNVEKVFPDASDASRQRLCREMWHSLFLMAMEIAWADRRLHRCNWSEHFAFGDNREMLSLLLSDRPCISVSGHFGNFEVAGYVTGLMGLRTLAIARTLDNPFLDRWVKRFREAKGQFIVDKSGCATTVDRHLQNGGILAMLADQHAGNRGVWQPFMGVPASCHKALALFVLGGKVPMAVVNTRRIGGRPMRLQTCVDGILDPGKDPEHPALESVDTLTRWYNDRLAEGVAVAVEQYWWLHRRWRSPPRRILKKLAKQQARAKSASESAASGSTAAAA